MRFLLFISLLVCSSSGFSKSEANFKSFNKEMNKHLDEVIEENPQMYETKSMERKPASVKKVEPESTEKLDAIDEHADTHMGW